MRLLYLVFTCCLVSLISCNNSSNSSSSSTTDSTKTKPKPASKKAESKLNEAGTTILMSVVTGYYNLKNALVATKATDADSAAAKLIVIADSLQSFLKKDATNGTALKPYVDTIIKESKTIAGINDKSCEKQRASFETISNAVYGLLKVANIKNAGVYHEYCPMAFNDKGAFWLSDDMEIRNPYFGQKMMECGEVKDSL